MLVLQLLRSQIALMALVPFGQCIRPVDLLCLLVEVRLRKEEQLRFFLTQSFVALALALGAFAFAH